ncbi:Uncharacterized protein SCG7086_BQ_00090 [Chlamydiales bacterium SCGC AG-110-P3]|nr:Uncharacterized protein SCG7086_BQ_00090 [Chlamydiales bacterium SCGC AG-110-P3]
MESYTLRDCFTARSVLKKNWTIAEKRGYASCCCGCIYPEPIDFMTSTESMTPSNRFPPPIDPTDQVFTARRNRNRQVIRASWIGIMVRCVIIAMEVAGVWAYGSSVLLLDALGTAVDVVTSVVLIICIRLAARPPDRNHPFGHGRYEPLAGLQLGAFLVVLGCVMTYQQGVALYAGQIDRVIGGEVWMIPLVAAAFLAMAARRLRRIARQEDSPALIAEAAHFRIDALNSLFAAGVLLIALFIPEYSGQIDRVGALAIAVVMIGVGLHAASSNFHQLMDRIPDDSYFQRVRYAACSVEGVCDTEKIRIQQYGPDAHVDIDVEVDPHLSVEDAHAISQKVRAAIQEAWPQVQDVTVHIEPYYPGDH